MPKSESELFREAMAGVRPLARPNRHEPAQPTLKPSPRQRQIDESRVMDELLAIAPDDLVDLETGEELMFVRPGHPPRLLRRLRRGHYSIRDSIDLHHMSESTARRVLLEFLDASLARGFGCLRIVHGKGLRSKGEPKLKRMTSHVLRRHPAVIAFASCRAVDGGTGAVILLLKTGSRRRS